MPGPPIRPLERRDVGAPDRVAFANPDPSLGIQVEWLWDAPVERTGIDDQLRAFADAGLREVVVEAWDGLVAGTEPGPSTVTPYLSAAFLDLLAHTAVTAESLGLCLWVYDGNGAGDDTGAVALALAGHDELRSRSLHRRTDGGFEVVVGSGLDRLNPAAAGRLVEVEHQRILDRLATSGVGALRGFWKDEPHLPGDGLPWSPDLPDAFAQTHGYALTDEVLTSVLSGDRPRDRRRRADFWGTVARRYADAYLGALGRWHRDHGLTLLVQPLPDGVELLRQRRTMGSLPTANAAAGLVGCDMWPGCRDDEPLVGEEGAGLTHVQAVSAAHLAGSTRVQAEPYGVDGWGVEPRLAKALFARLYARGINIVAPAVAHYGHGLSQAVFAGDFGPRNGPLWAAYDLLQQHTARIGELLCGSAHVAPVALLHPQTSVWVLPDGDGDEELRNAYSTVGGVLLATGHGFDVVAEEILADPGTHVDGGAIRRLDHAFTTVVLPALTTLQPATVDTLEELVAQRGRVLAVGRRPFRCAAGDDDRLRARMDALFAHPHAEDVAVDVTTTAADDGLDGLDPLVGALDRAVGPRARVTWRDGDPAASTIDLYHARRGGADVVLVVHYPRGAHRARPATRVAPPPAVIELQVPRGGQPQLWDPDSGLVTVPPRWWADERGTVVELELTACAAMLVVVGADELPGALSQVPEGPATVIEGLWHVTFAAVDLPLSPSVPPPADLPLGDVAARHPGFVGVASYQTKVTTAGGDLLLDLGDVREQATVRVDGSIVGRRPWPPYTVTATGLAPGEHVVTIEVLGTAANAVPGPDHDPARPWGLFGPVTIRERPRPGGDPS